MRIGHSILALLSAALLFTACSDDENGGGHYPSVYTELVEIISDDRGKACELRTDADESFPLNADLSALKLEFNDTVRCICIFERKDDNTINLYSCQKIVAPKPAKAEKFPNGIKSDSIYFQSIWRSGHYVNFHFQMMGKDKAHYLHMIEDTLMLNPNGSHTLRLRLYHDQNKDTKAFHLDSYVSVPLRDYERRGAMKKGDTITISANTYDHGNQTWKVAY